MGLFDKLKKGMGKTKNSFDEKGNAEENEFKIRNHKLIKGSFKRHISKNDNLNNLIKRKLKEKKFLK